MIENLFLQLFIFANFSCQAPTFGQIKTKPIGSFNKQVCRIKHLNPKKVDGFILLHDYAASAKKTG